MTDRILLKKILTNIRFWIILFFLIRLIGITNAPLETSHNWRQTLTSMIARNFLENGLDLMHPMIDMTGTNSGIIGSEFPFFNFLIYLFAKLFGYEHWYGRLINLVISSIGVFYFYKIIKRVSNYDVAFGSTLIFIASIWFAFSRKIMPDTFSVSLVLIGLYYGYNFILKNGFLNILLFFALCTLGMLCKIPAMALFSVVLILFFIKNINLKRKIILLFASVLSILIVSLWYFHWVPHLIQNYGNQLFFPKEIREGIVEIMPLLPELFKKFYFSSLQSYIAFICLASGLILIGFKENKLFVTGLGIITVVFIVYIIKSGAVFPTHNYYIIPYTPVMAFAAGYFVAQIKNNFKYFLIGFIVIEGIINQQHDFFIKESTKYKLQLEKIADNHIPKSGMIVINGGFSPQDIYFANRNGWSLENEKIKNLAYIDSLTNAGAGFLIIDKVALINYSSDYKKIYNDKFYTIYKLN